MNVSFIRHQIKRYFPGEAVDAIFEILREYDERPRPDFTYVAILRLSRGEKQTLRPWIERAKVDRVPVLHAAEYVESWEQVVESYASDVSSHSPCLSPLLELARSMLATPYAQASYAQRSVGRLVISSGRWGVGGSRIVVSLEPSHPTAGELRVEYSSKTATSGALKVLEADAALELGRLLDKLMHRPIAM